MKIFVTCVDRGVMQPVSRSLENTAVQEATMNARKHGVHSLVDSFVHVRCSTVSI